jgi:MFS family permease
MVHSSRGLALFILCLAELCILSVWYSAQAVLPSLVVKYGLGDGGRAGLAMAVQGGFILGTLLSALFNLPDILPPRRLLIVGAIVGALANAAVALSPGLGLALLLRVLTGVAMALAYPPAMKILATWWTRGRGFAIGMLIAALTVGTATPHLLRGVSSLSPSAVLLSASGLSLCGALLVVFGVHEGPHPFPRARLDLHMFTAVLRTRGPRLMCLGYFGHMWELYAMWAWLAAFLEASRLAGATGQPPTYFGWNVSIAAFFVMGVGGALGAALGGVLAERFGRTLLCAAAMAASGLCALCIGFSFGGDPRLTLGLAFVWGATVIADSAQFSAGVTELCEPAYVGTALTAQTCIGFAITLLSIWLVPRIVALFGWHAAFAVLSIGPFLGVVAMLRLRGLPEAARLASGRR